MPNCAPEVTETGNVSQAAYVYSFGFVLLELITGKRSLHTTDDGQEISLADWIKSVLRYEWSNEVIDVEILRYPEKVEAVVWLLQIAMDCVVFVPERRPRMPEIVKMLEELSGLDPSDGSSLDDVLEDTWEQPSIESRLENLLEDLLPRLTP